MAEEGLTEVERSLTDLLAAARKGGKTVVEYEVPAEADADAYAAWVVTTLDGLEAGRDPAPRAGFVVQPVSGDSQLWVIVEEPRQKRGVGAVVLRAGPARPLLVETPHTFFDEKTLDVGVAVFLRTQARAWLLNTVHRYRATGGEAPADDRHSPSDVAHAPVSAFLSVHRALVQRRPDLWTVQLHGFAAGGDGVDVVVSPARTNVDVRPLAADLRAALTGFEVRTYPDEFDRLGGTTNVQAAASRNAGARFVHVEMSRRLRDALTTDGDPALRTAFARAVETQAGPVGAWDIAP